MNQIIFFKNEKSEETSNKIKKKYIIIFLIFLLFTIFFSLILFNKLYENYNNEKLSQKLNNSYSISTLYANNTNTTIDTISNNPFVIGIIQIDKINLNYSILSVCNNDLLDISVCRFAGPMPNEIGNLCVAGHNYVDYNFFSRLNELSLNDKSTIYDLNGNHINYSIYDIYEINSNDTSCTFQDTKGQKIVTLITCNNVNGKRLIIHAKEIP